MPKAGVFLWSRWRSALYLGLAVSLTHCGEKSGEVTGISWTFVNNDTGPVSFDADTDDSQLNPTVAGGGQVTTVTTESFDYEDVSVSVSAYRPQSSILLGRANHEASVGAGQTTAITVVWDGTNLTISSACAAPSPARSLGIFEPAAACQAPVWTLEGTTGLTSKTWQSSAWNGTQNITWTGNGTVSINWPQTLSPGETVVLPATFSASATYPQGAISYSPVTINAGLYAPGQNNATLAETSKVIGTPSAASPTVSGAVTITATYTVPSNGPGGKLTFYVNAYTSLFGFCFCSDVPTATYSKVP